MAESGHARNIEHFATLISFIQGYGVAYNPANAAITLAALQAKLASAQASIDSVATALAPWKTGNGNIRRAPQGVVRESIQNCQNLW